MMRTAIFGAALGDEAKGRFAHFLANDYRWCIKVSGSSNTGHTIYHQGKKIVRHLLPSADFSLAHNHVFLGSDMVIDPDALLKEILETEELFPKSATRIVVDPDAFIITSQHLEEDKENIKRIGSTGKGVSPCYRDKVNRIGVKFLQLIKDNDPRCLKMKELGVQFKHNLEMRQEFINSHILFEGSQSIMLDYNFGSYPYVSSGNCGLNGIINSGFAYLMPTKIYGVIKAYSTAVGNMPFPTEASIEDAEKLRKLGVEFGSTTSRPRRCGWLDFSALRYSIAKGGITNLLISKLDILNGYSSFPICTHYDKEPVSGSDFFTAKPNYIEYPGWEDIKNQPEKIRKFVEFIEENTGSKVDMVSCGVNDDDVLTKFRHW